MSLPITSDDAMRKAWGGELEKLTKNRGIKDPTLADAIVPLALLAILIGGAIALFGLGALDGPIQAAMVLCALIVALVILKNGHSWSSIQESGQQALSSVTSAIFILLAVGALIGVWNMSGTIPTLVYYGMLILAPSWYYAATALICGIVALSIGSSWTTAATIGVGLVGIGTMLGVSPAITAGAVISGAYLGDKLSPLSETTILTAQMAGVEPREHIKRQAWTSLPAFGLAFIVFLILGFTSEITDTVATSSELSELSSLYNINPWNLLPLLLLGILSARKVPASLALMFSALFAGVLGSFLQPGVVATFSGESNMFMAGLKGTWTAMANGFVKESGIADIDRLLSRGGMESMLPTLWLIMAAVTFGTLLEKYGLISRLIMPMLAWAKSTGKLYIAVFVSAMGLNIVAGDQYIALVLPARVYKAEFAKRGLAPTNLSRLTADSGTVTSALVPWNSCGAFMSAALGVSTLVYLPFALFNIFSPLLSVLYGFTGFKIERIEPSGVEAGEEAAKGPDMLPGFEQ